MDAIPTEREGKNSTRKLCDTVKMSTAMASSGRTKCPRPGIGAYKMSEAEFDAMNFTEVLALVGGDENAGSGSQYAAQTRRPSHQMRRSA